MQVGTVMGMAKEYIDKEAVLEIVSEWCPDDDGSVGKIGDLREMLDEIEAIPAADVRENVKGAPVPHYETWLNSDMEPVATVRIGIECPFCGDTGIKNFCPNCGAQMMDVPDADVGKMGGRKMGLCNSCEKKRNGGCKGNEPWEVIVYCEAYKMPPTNADRIRAYTDEELAAFMRDIGLACPDAHFVGDCGRKDCRDCWLDWLKSPVEVDNGGSD